MTENLYERIRRIVETTWRDRIAILYVGEEQWFYKDALEKYLNREYDIPVNKSSPIISKLKNAGVITYVDTRRGKIKCILGEPTTKQGSIHSGKGEAVHTFEAETEATISLSNAIRIALNSQLMYELRSLYPELDAEAFPKWSSRKRKVEIKGNENEIIIKIRRK